MQRPPGSKRSRSLQLINNCVLRSLQRSEQKRAKRIRTSRLNLAALTWRAATDDVVVVNAEVLQRRVQAVPDEVHPAGARGELPVDGDARRVQHADLLALFQRPRDRRRHPGAAVLVTVHREARLAHCTDSIERYSARFWLGLHCEYWGLYIDKPFGFPEPVLWNVVGASKS